MTAVGIEGSKIGQRNKVIADDNAVVQEKFITDSVMHNPSQFHGELWSWNGHTKLL